MNAITDRNDDIEVVESNFMRLHFPFYSPMLSGCSEKPNYHIGVQFSFFENVLKMFANSRFCLTKEGNHLFLSYPHCLVLKNDINSGFAFFRLIDNNLSFGIFCEILCIHKTNLFFAKVLLFIQLCKFIAQKIYFFMQYSEFIAQNRSIQHDKSCPIIGNCKSV